MTDALKKTTHLPTDAKARKRYPICTGLLDYFPNACAAVAELSMIGNEQHNPGQPLHWARGKSTDHGDTLLRHQMERGTVDTDGVRHSTKVAWRALAQLEEELEQAGHPRGRGSKTAEPERGPRPLTATEVVDSWKPLTLNKPS